jgi:hypothetical protein
MMTGAALPPALIRRAGQARATSGFVAQVKVRAILLAGVKFDTPTFGFPDESSTPPGSPATSCARTAMA